jgi:hypothetical protein
MKIELKVDSVSWIPSTQNGMQCCDWNVRIEAFIKDGEGNNLDTLFESRTLFLPLMYLQVRHRDDRELRLVDKVVSEITTMVEKLFYNKEQDEWDEQSFKTGDLATWDCDGTSIIILFVEETISVVPILNGKPIEERVLGEYLFFQHDWKGRQVKEGYAHWMSGEVELKSSVS